MGIRADWKAVAKNSRMGKIYSDGDKNEVIVKLQMYFDSFKSRGSNQVCKY